MKTKVFKWPEAKQLAVAASVKYISQNEVVALPTETVYGLAARFNEEAISKIYEVKQRPSDNPLIVHVNSVLMAMSCCDLNVLPRRFFKLTEAFWPGPLTLVLKKAPELSDFITCGLDTVAVRMPGHEVMQYVINALGEPLVAPSANLSGRPSPTRAGHVLDDLEGEIPMVIDAGAAQFGLESTVIDLSGLRPVLLRPGSITVAEVELVLGESVYAPEKHSKVPRAPGMKYRHYAPEHAEVMLVEDVQFFEKVSLQPDSLCCAVLAESSKTVQKLSSQNVYDLFRQADRDKINKIYILKNDLLEQDAALMNRIQKAASQSEN